jgi:hypothetical protein
MSEFTLQEMHGNTVATLKSASFKWIGECQACGIGTYFINIAKSGIYAIVVGQEISELLPVPLK